MPPEKPMQYSRQAFDAVESGIKAVQGSVKEGDSLDTLRKKAAEKRELETQRTDLHNQAWDQAIEENQQFDKEKNQQAEADRMEAARLLREIRGDAPSEVSAQETGQKPHVKPQEENQEVRDSGAGTIEGNSKNVETIVAAKDNAPRPLSDFIPAQSSPEELKKNGGLYSGRIKGEEQTKLFADLPWDQKMMKGILDKVCSVSSDAAEALELMWENGDPRSPLMVRGAGDELMDFGPGKDKIPGSRAVGIDFLRGGEYKAGMKGAIDDSYEAKEENEAGKFLRTVKASALLGIPASALATLAFEGGAGGILGALASGTAVGMGGVALPLAAGFAVWRMYKHFRNKRMHERQTECLDKL